MLFHCGIVSNIKYSHQTTWITRITFCTTKNITKTSGWSITVCSSRIHIHAMCPKHWGLQQYAYLVSWNSIGTNAFTHSLSHWPYQLLDLQLINVTQLNLKIKKQFLFGGWLVRLLCQTYSMLVLLHHFCLMCTKMISVLVWQIFI